MEQCLSDATDVNYEKYVSSDYYCTDEDDHFAQFRFVYALITTL